MKTVWNSICLSFSMFSVFPTPKTDWNRKNMRYMLCALPLVGAVIGALMAACDRLCVYLGAEPVLRGALLTVLPVILSGGIHLDGFCDTADALASHAEPERKREIMKDSHAGAFAVIACGAYLLLYFAACCSVPDYRLFFVIPVLSRSAGAFGGTVFRGAGRTGLLAAFRDGADASSARILGIWMVLCLGGLCLIRPLYAAAGLAASALCLLLTGRLAEKQFGGMSGDLAGHLNVLTELTALLFCILADMIGGMI